MKNSKERTIKLSKKQSEQLDKVFKNMEKGVVYVTSNNPDWNFENVIKAKDHEGKKDLIIQNLRNEKRQEDLQFTYSPDQDFYYITYIGIIKEGEKFDFNERPVYFISEEEDIEKFVNSEDFNFPDEWEIFKKSVKILMDQERVENEKQ